MSELFSFGAWVRRRRKALDLTREELAPRVGCAVVTIRRIETDERRPSKQLASRLAECLKVPPQERAAFLQAARGELAVDQLAAPTHSLPHSPQGAVAGALQRPASSLLPGGTVTFLFTDTEERTRRWEQHSHATILRQAIAAHDGAVFHSAGDACYAAFTSAPAALRAALAGQSALQDEHWGETGPIRVRMALHTAAIEIRDGEYHGQVLNRLARLLDAGHGGQILLSAATQELVRDDLPPGVQLRDMGRHRLKDLARPEQIFQIVSPDLPTNFPPLHTLDRRPHNLPPQPTTLIGREHEIVALCSLLRRTHVRLVTLTGPGGTGKTRLGLQVAAELLDDVADGVWFVNLAPVSDPHLLTATIAQALGIKERMGSTLLDSLKDWLREKQLLLFLDNFEQIAVAAPLVNELLAGAPGLKVLVTSRMPLHLSGEHEFAVAPLSLPPRDSAARRTTSTTADRASEPVTVAELTRYAAVQLFIERAQAVKADFAVTDANAPVVAEICVRLDGLPLAIELAAVRVKLFPPPALLTRLERRLQLLTNGARDLPARQQTMRNTIDWSYQLLDTREQRLFSRLGVFVGGCTLAAVEAVCNAEGDLGPEALDGLAALVDQSLVRQDEGLDGEPRIMLLETIREYALECLAASGEMEATRRRYATHYLAQAEAAESELHGPNQKHWMDRLEQEHDNLRAVLDWCVARGETELGLQLGRTLWRLWDAQGHLTEGRARLSTLLAQAAAHPPTTARVQVLHGAGLMAWDQGDVVAARALWEEGLTIARELGEPSAIADALQDVGWITYRQGDATTARRMIEESLAIHRNLGNQRGASLALNRLAQVAAGQGDYATARSLGEQGLTIMEELEDSTAIASLLNTLGEIARIQSDYPLARSRYERSLVLARASNDTYLIASTCANLGYITLNEGDPDRAALLFKESLALSRQTERTEGMILCLVGLAGSGNVCQQPERAARLLGAAAAFLEATHAALDTTDRHDYDRIVADVRSQLDEAAFATAWAEGRAMPIAHAIADALEPAQKCQRQQ